MYRYLIKYYLKTVPIDYLYQTSLFDSCDGEPQNTEAVELVCRLNKGTVQ